jgi:dipeptidyl aminopeptidase/acylaminoacyl peptidase
LSLQPGKVKPKTLKPNRWRRWLSLTLFGLVSAFISIAAGLLWLEVNLLTKVWRHPVAGSPADVHLAYQDVSLTTPDGLTLAAWYIPGRQPNGVVLVHGIHANREAVLPAAVMLAEAGYHVLMIDLRGHGASQGEQLSYGYREALDVQTAASYLLALPEVERVGAMGYSLGGAAVARAARLDERLQAVVIQSSFSSLSDAVEDSFTAYTALPKWPLAPLIVKAAEFKLGLRLEQVDSSRDLAGLTPRPVFIIHGRQDGLFPVHQAYKMYAMAGQPKQLWVIEELGHDYPFNQRTEYQHRVLAFFAEAFRAQPPTP